MANLTASSANVYLVDDRSAWQRLRSLAAQESAPGSPEESVLLNALIGEAATVHLASPDQRASRFTDMIDHVTKAGDMGGLHGPFLSLLSDAVQRGDTGATQAGFSAWQSFAGRQAPRATKGAVQVYDPVTGDWIPVDPAALRNVLPPLPSSLTDAKGIVAFLNGVDKRIRDAFGNPTGNAALDAEVADIAGSLNEAAVTLAQMAAIGMAVPGGQSIGAILLVAAGVAAVGAAVVTLVGAVADFFSSNTPTSVPLPQETPISEGSPVGTNDPAQPVVAQPPVDPAPSNESDIPSTPNGLPPTDPVQPSSSNDQQSDNTANNNGDDTETTVTWFNDIPDTREPDTPPPSDDIPDTREPDPGGGGDGDDAGDGDGGDDPGDHHHGPWREEVAVEEDT